MKQLGVLAFSALILAASACTTKPAELPVRIQVNRQVDFRALRSFRPAAAGVEEASAYPKLQRLAKEIVIEEMVSRGFERLENGTPDFRLRTYLRFNSYLSQKMGASKTTAEATIAPSDQRDVTLVVEIVGSRDEKRYWQGTVSGFHLDPINSRSSLKGAAWRLLAEFPPLF